MQVQATPYIPKPSESKINFIMSLVDAILFILFSLFSFFFFIYQLINF